MGFKFQNELFFKLLLNFQVGKVAGTTYYRNFFPSKGYCDMDMHQLVDIFCEVDDFCNELDKHCQNYMLSGPTKSNRGPTCDLSISEIMTILVMFQMSGFRDFKNFYTGFLSFYHKSYFPNLPCYGRFVRAIFPLTIFTQLKAGKQTGIYYIDSSCLPVCHIKRSKRHKTFDLVAAYGKTSAGWFFGLKLHIVTNDHGELLAFKITRGNKSDSQEAVPLLKSLKGLAFGDKGYIGKKIFEELLNGGLKLITRKRKNMKDKQLLSCYEKQLLNQRGIIETVIGHLKHCYQVWHTRHRSIINAMTHLVAALAAYAIEPLKLSAIKLLANCA
ncbi:IS982 family transposase [Legionella oakridgensis]|uniref:Membrane-associated, metal-dependent hydrolase n=2 Tax=Legionella oakridgensis TaxID=29423 RepID=A0A0W0X0F7_9GAMM|nr:IS982 family transposase [Legionella oakridgensis]KTD38064.1 membrane-associated, metal-dependent hydrolase [Legionella oakridgensis]STY20213.1 membrane-associated, metal-dependent hydrolase [Legionella longbeachae]